MLFVIFLMRLLDLFTNVKNKKPRKSFYYYWLPILQHQRFALGKTKRKTRLYRYGVVESVEFSAEDASIPIPQSAAAFFSAVLQVQPDDSFEKISHQSKRAGFVHEHYNQHYKGVRRAATAFTTKTGQCTLRTAATSK